MHCDKWTEVTLGIFVRVEVAGKTTSRQVVDRPNVLLVGRILAFTGHPDRVELQRIVSLQTRDVLLKVDRHFLRQVFGVVVKGRPPAVNLSSKNVRNVEFLKL